MRRAVTLLTSSLLVLLSCSPSSDTASNYPDSTAVDREQGESEVAARLDAVRARLDSLKSDAVALGPQVSAAMDAGIAAAEVQRDSAQVRFEELRTAGTEKWQDVRQGVAVMLDSLETRIERLRRDLDRSG